MKKEPTKKTTVDTVKKIKDINEALFMLQGENITVPRRATGNINGRTYKYATLDDAMNEARPYLQKYGIMVTQVPDGERVTTRLVHVETGTEISGNLLLGNPASSQDLGSRITYLSRYMLRMMLGIVLEDDLYGIQSLPTDAPKTTAPVAPKPVENVVSNESQASFASDESENYLKAKGMILACASLPALNLVKQQISNSKKITDAEKFNLMGIVNNKSIELK